MTDLGLEMHSMVIALREAPSPVEARLLLDRLINRIRMRTGGLDCQIWDYPVAEGGGVGFTLVQPLLESLSGVVAIDAWPELQGGGLCYVLIHSCRPFRARAVIRWLKGHGWQVAGWHYGRVDFNRKLSWWERLWRWVHGKTSG